MSRPTTLPEPWKALALRMGGVARLAAALLCAPVTLRRWAAGTQQPDPRARAWIAQVFRRAKMTPP